MRVPALKWVGGIVVLAAAAAAALMLATTASSAGPIVHQVNAGGPDSCVDLIGAEHPGCDGNWSLVGQQLADGTSRGEFTDRFANGDGFHAVLDCVSVVGNTAWVSGVITEGTGFGIDLAGLDVVTEVQDNGTSANDPPDKISFSFIGFGIPCTSQPALPLGDAPEGQVTVR
jgi:hypothetical protein